MIALSLWGLDLPGGPWWLAILAGLGLVLGHIALVQRARNALLAELAGVRESERRHVLALNASDDGFWDWKVADDALYVSPRLLEMFDFPPGTKFAGRAALFGRLSIPAQDRAALDRAVSEHFAGKTSRMDVEFRSRVRGELRWMRAVGRASRDGSGAVARWNGSVRDVTARRDAEQALRRSEERFRSLTELSSDFFWEADTEHRYTAIELGWAYTGVRNNASKLGFARWEIAYASPDEAEWAAHRAAIAARERFVDFRFSRIEEGEERFYEHSGEPRYDEQGVFVGYRGIGRDITARRRAEAELRESESRFRSLIQISSDWYWRQDENLRFTYLSEGVSERAGWPGEDYIGRLRWEVPDIHLMSTTWEEHKAVLARRQPFRELEYWRRGGDGIVTYSSISGAPIYDEHGAFKGYHGVGRNITQRKQVEEALRLSEERHALAMRASGAGHWDWKIESDEFYASPRYLEFGGFPADIRYTRRADIVSRIPFHPDDRARYEEAVAAHFAGETPRVDLVIRVTPHGETRWLHVIGMCLRDADGKPVRWAGSVTDITARKLAEEAQQLSEERYALALEVTEEGHFDWNVRTDRVFASARCLRMLGIPLGEYRTWNEALAYVPFHPDDAASIRERWRAALAGPGTDHEFEYRILRRNQTRWIRGRWKIFRDPDGSASRVVGVVADITERKLAADELRASEARFRALTELWSDWYWELDENLRFTYSSAAVSPPDGYPGGSVIGKARWELAGAVPLSSSWAEHRAILEAHQPFRDFEYSRPAADGTLRYISTSGLPIFDDQGSFKGYQGMARNITTRKRVEDALRLSEARYARAMDASADGLWEWNAATDELFISPRARELWGIPDSFEIRTCAELKARNLQFTEETIRECSAQRSGVEMTYSVLNQEGELRWVRSMGKVSLGRQGEPLLVTGSLTDVTERKVAVDALQRSEEELRARQDMLDLAQKVASAVAFEWHLGAGEGENRWSSALEAMYGLEPGSYDGTFEAWKAIVSSEDWPAVQAALQRAHDTGDIAAEYRVVHPGGAVRWLQAKGRMFFDDERKPTRAVGFMLDVTDRHQAEEELQRLERQLRQAQRLEAMGTLAGGIAHDFNNILGAILGYGEMAMRDAPKGSRLARDLDSIIVAGERGRALVDRVLAFSRSGVGERVPVHVEKVVREALDLVAAQLPRNVALRAKLRAGHAAMLGDATQVHQVVMNLVTNAVQAMAAGGKLRVSLDVVRLGSGRVPTIGIIDPGEYLVLEVADSGTGIPPEVLERIFDPFFTTKEVGTGTGLGLSLVHGIVAELGGGIDVTSTPGKGSTFAVYLPRSGETVDAPENEAPELPRGDGQRVLVVDDEEPLVRLATRTLEELGYVPVGFTSSNTALAAFRADPQRFDALVTDERMPGMSGSVLIREVRSIRGSMPVVLMSGYLGAAGSPEAAGRSPKLAAASGADEVLQKPLSARDLAASLARVLRL